jgi:hypothetical protein
MRYIKSPRHEACYGQQRIKGKAKMLSIRVYLLSGLANSQLNHAQQYLRQPQMQNSAVPQDYLDNATTVQQPYRVASRHSRLEEYVAAQQCLKPHGQVTDFGHCLHMSQVDMQVESGV